MKYFAYILLLFCFGASVSVSHNEKFYTNAPDLVYPTLEEFIAENHLRGTSVLQRLQNLDSVVVRDLGYDVNGPFIRKITGTWIRTGANNTIVIDPVLLEDPERFKSTFQHELGHYFGMKHIDVDGLPIDDPRCFEIMSNRKSPYYNKEYQDAAVDKYYSQLHFLLMPLKIKL